MTHVLVVDDEADIREVAQVALEAVAGWRVTPADSGAQALERARREPPDAILLDVQMPDLDGPGALEALRAQPETRHVPVVFLTARAGSADRDRLAGLGVAGVLAKPFDPMTLGDEVARTLGWT